jgi:hypothetical protein
MIFHYFEQDTKLCSICHGKKVFCRTCGVFNCYGKPKNPGAYCNDREHDKDIA